MPKPTLYSYVVRTDSGAAPNPFGGVCSLVICKPDIREHAEVGDWIVGTGSANSEVGNIQGQVVYAMRVSAKMTMAEYDDYAQEHLPIKVPDGQSGANISNVGDAIYDFSETPPRLRDGVHCEEERERDLGGRFALLSDHFYYFGAQAKPLPEHLRPIVKKRQGHRSTANEGYVDDFIEWIEGLDARPNHLQGLPAGFRSVDRGNGSPKESCGQDRGDAPSSRPNRTVGNPNPDDLDRLQAEAELPNAQTAAYLAGTLIREQTSDTDFQALVTTANLAVLRAWDEGVDLTDLDSLGFEIHQGEEAPASLEIVGETASVSVPIESRSYELRKPWSGFYQFSKVVEEDSST